MLIFNNCFIQVYCIFINCRGELNSPEYIRVDVIRAETFRPYCKQYSMKQILILALSLLGGYFSAINAQEIKKEVTIEINNSWRKDKADAPVAIKLSEINPGFTVNSLTVWDGNKEVPSQLDDLDNDQKADELAFVIGMPAKSNKTLKLILSSEKKENKYPARVYADMLLSGKKKHQPIRSLTIPGTSDIYNLLHHHGPAFESELAAYRIYFDKKQTVDIYGKFNKGLELEACGFYPNDEQLAKGFGDDVLRVSGSCGLGTLKGWDGKKALHIEPVEQRTERILAYGPIRTVVDVEVNNWQYQGKELNMINRYILYAGHRDVEVQVSFAEPLENETFCTGVQNIKDSDSFSDHKGLIACWGTDWPVNDTVKYAKETVGLATCIPQKYVQKESKDKANYLYVVQAKGRKTFNYNITFTSMKETFGYKTKEAWFAFVREWKKELEHPCTVEIK